MATDDLRKRFDGMTADKLREIVSDWDDQQWTATARELAGELLLERGESIPSPPSDDERTVDSELSLPESTATLPSPTVDAPLLTSRKILSRYSDAYRVARFTVGFGAAIKLLSIAFGVVGLLIALSMSQLSGPVSALLLIGAIAVAAVLFVLGTLTSAQGEVLKATLDSAVHTCPFADLDEKAQIMNLD